MKRLFLIFTFLALSLALLPPPLMAVGREESAAEAAKPRLDKKLGSAFKLGNPVFLRIFKDEAIVEIWMLPENSQKFKLFHSYPICAFSGGLGPKTKEGDRKAPEGFYAVGLRHLNPFSNYHLSFDLDYPNAYDRAQGYTGSLLMVHGNCLSDGCYAMTDPQIEEIYTLAKAALDNGQPFFRVHIFPFRLTASNLALYKNYPWHDFWTMLEPVYAYFEKHGHPPDVAVEKGLYKISGL
ncbi:2-dehydro-3-deoxyphosphooctonate aldolase [Deltaproteobacteria bacterium Smac51]|nr:2-dehydro-3-deoxyphosphooctonate aldolase [Deltaproteobacteria bacterium Smac51]